MEKITERIEQIKRGEVPSGYVKTKDGIFPADWSTKRIEDWVSLCERPIELKDDESYQLVTVRRAFGGVDSRGYFKGKDIFVKTYFEVREGDFVISKRQIAHGACGVVPACLDHAVVSNEYNVFVPKDKTNIAMFYLMMHLPHYLRLFYLMSDGVHIEKLLFKTKDWLRRNLAMPPIQEQRKIAEILSVQNRVITLYEGKIEQIKLFKKACLRRMFPKGKSKIPEVRFPGFTEPWEMHRFKDFTWAAGKRNRENLDLEPYAITNEHGFIPQNKAHDEFGYMKDTDRKAYNIVEPYSFAYNPARINVGSIGYYAGFENVIVSSLYEVFKTVDYVDDKFLWHWFKSDELPKWIERLQEGSVRMYFYYDKLCECQILMPSLPEQKKISLFFDNLDSYIALYQRKRDEEKQKKKALMQLLLTGIVRVKE